MRGTFATRRATLPVNSACSFWAAAVISAVAVLLRARLTVKSEGRLAPLSSIFAFILSCRCTLRWFVGVDLHFTSCFGR